MIDDTLRGLVESDLVTVQTATDAWSSMGLCGSFGVMYVAIHFDGAAAKAVSDRPVLKTICACRSSRRGLRAGWPAEARTPRARLLLRCRDLQRLGHNDRDVLTPVANDLIFNAERTSLLVAF